MFTITILVIASRNFIYLWSQVMPKEQDFGVMSDFKSLKERNVYGKLREFF